MEWRKCSSCKKPIALGAKYFVCSVSTCNGQRTGYVFCTLPCFETHLPGARHKQAGAIEKIAPLTNDPTAPSAAPSAALSREPESRTPARILIKPAGGTPSAVSTTPREVLVIASRLKEYIAARADYNTSASVMDVLSDYLRILCDRGIENARAEGRKTVLDRDFDFLKKA